MRTRDIGDTPARSHAGDLLDPLLLAQGLHAGAGATRAGALDHPVVRLAQRCDLRQVRDAENLMAAPECPQAFAHPAGGTPAHAGVDLVEEQDTSTIRVSQHVAQRQLEARKLASRGGVAQSPGLLTGIGREQERRSLLTARTGRGGLAIWGLRGQALEANAELGPPELERAQLTGDLGLELLGRGAARPAQARGSAVQRGRRFGDRGFELGAAPLSVAQVLELGA